MWQKYLHGINPLVLFAPWGDYKNKKIAKNMKIKQTTLKCNTKISKELTQQALVPLGTTLDNTYLHNWKLEQPEKLPWSQSMYWWHQVKQQNRYPYNKLPQTCTRSKYVYPVWIRPTDNLKSQPRKSFRINELWSNSYDTHKSKINKIIL